MFFTSWLFFPILFLMGPEGFGHLSAWGSIIAHTLADLMSKNLWGLLAHHLRNKVHHTRSSNWHVRSGSVAVALNRVQLMRNVVALATCGIGSA